MELPLDRMAVLRRRASAMQVGTAWSPGRCWGQGRAGSTGQGVAGAFRLFTTLSCWALGCRRFSCHSKEPVFIHVRPSAYLGICGHRSFWMTGLWKIQQRESHPARIPPVSRSTGQCSACWGGWAWGWALCADRCGGRAAPLGGTVSYPARPQAHWKDGLTEQQPSPTSNDWLPNVLISGSWFSVLVPCILLSHSIRIQPWGRSLQARDRSTPAARMNGIYSRRQLSAPVRPCWLQEAEQIVLGSLFCTQYIITLFTSWI